MIGMKSRKKRKIKENKEKGEKMDIIKRKEGKVREKERQEGEKEG